jgi:diaminopimelate epimerase
MIEFAKGEGCGNDFVLIPYKSNYNYKGMASKLLRRRFSIGGDGLIVMDGKKMRFFNPDGVEVPFCGNGVRVFFYLLYLEGKVNDKDEILTGAGTIPLKYEGKNEVSALMPEIKTGEKKKEGVIIHCGVPHLVIQEKDISNINVEEEGENLSKTLPEGNNVSWFEDMGDSISIRTYERGVFGETLSCASGVASVSYLAMKNKKRDKIKIKSRGGLFKAAKDKKNDNRIILSGKVSIIYKGSIPEKEDYWQKKGIF